MELQSFDLVWLVRPIETCLSGEDFIEGREAELRIDGPIPVTYVAWLGYCAHDDQWYGLQEMLDEILANEGWSYGEIEGFAIDESPVTTGIQVGFQQRIVSWSTFRDQTAHAATSAREEKPPPTRDEVHALERRPTTWEIGWRPVGWVGPSDEEAQLVYAALVHDAAGHIRTTTLSPGAPPDVETLDELTRRAAAQPDPPGTPIRPATLHVADETMAAALADRLAPLDIRVKAHPTPQAQEALAQLTEHLSPDRPPPYFVREDADAIRAYFETATRFFEHEPWTRFEGHKFLGFRFDGGPWHYANVMGQMEEAPGLALFDDWLQLCRFHHNQPSYFDEILSDLTGESPLFPLLEAAGAAEALTLDPLMLLHPDDAAHLHTLEITPVHGSLFPLPYRYDADRGQVAPRRSLQEYRALLEAIRIALERRRATPVTSIKTTLEVAGRDVTLRYPADGTERALDSSEHVQLVVEGWEDEYGPGIVPPGLHLHIDAPGSALFDAVAQAIEQFDEALSCTGVGSGELYLWDDRGRRKSPCPRVADLAGCADLWIELDYEGCPMTFHARSDPPPETIHVELAEA